MCTMNWICFSNLSCYQGRLKKQKRKAVKNFQIQHPPGLRAETDSSWLVLSKLWFRNCNVHEYAQGALKKETPMPRGTPEQSSLSSQGYSKAAFLSAPQVTAVCSKAGTRCFRRSFKLPKVSSGCPRAKSLTHGLSCRFPTAAKLLQGPQEGRRRTLLTRYSRCQGTQPARDASVKGRSAYC